MLGNETAHTLGGLTVEGGLNVKGDVFVDGHSIGWAGAGFVDARLFGVSGLDAEDQTSALQAAIDYCQQFAVSPSYNIPALRIPTGHIILSGVIDWKSCAIVGSGIGLTKFVWNGASNGTVMRKWSTAHPGDNSYALLEGVTFMAGTTQPATFLDLTTNAGVVDWGMRLRDVHFNNCLGDSVKIGAWINCHWEHLRFDQVGGYAIRMTPGASEYLSSFVLDGFTYDHNRPSNPGGGVFMIDNTAGATNVGVVEIANGRIEINTAWAAKGSPGTGAASSRAIVCFRSAGGARVVGLNLRNVTFQDATLMADATLLFFDSASSTGSPTLLWSNVRVDTVSAVLGGNWSASIVGPSAGALAGVGALNPHVSGSALTFGVGARLFSAAGSPESAVTAPVGSLFVRSDGGAATTLYVKESGAGSTGWIAK